MEVFLVVPQSGELPRGKQVIITCITLIHSSPGRMVERVEGEGKFQC